MLHSCGSHSSGVLPPSARFGCTLAAKQQIESVSQLQTSRGFLVGLLSASLRGFFFAEKIVQKLLFFLLPMYKCKLPP